MKKIIRNATIINEGKIFPADILITNGRIEKLAPQISEKSFAEEINGEGKFLFPGIIDDQVHFREPGLTHKATIYSESKAAVAGGITSFMEMPNTIPPATTIELLEAKYRIAQITSLANYSFFLGTSNDNIEEVKKADPKKICGVKIFMGSSTGKLVVDDPRALENIFHYAPTLIATHCETDSVIKANEEKFRKEYGDAIPVELHPVIRNEAQCYQSSSLAITLAKNFESRLHILHVSTEEELLLFTNSIPLDKKKITAEACVHHLWFDAEDYAPLGTLIKCNPAIKDARHKQKLLEALLDDRLDIIATDHAPHTWEEKHTLTPEGKINYFKTPSGLPLVQHSLNMMLEFYFQKKISLEKIVEKMSHAPAVCYQVKDRGFIREGYFADLILLDLNPEWKVSKENILYKCGWSPLQAQSFHGQVTQTFVNGRLVYSDGLFDESVNGMRLEFER
ncbi:MAG TPA: dihydroorotase [Chitinophagales bacterium]|nr:dihydroorotase [Chitinophagales bacterium]